MKRRRWRRRTINSPDRGCGGVPVRRAADTAETRNYICQVTVVDDAGGSFSFPRLALRVTAPAACARRRNAGGSANSLGNWQLAVATFIDIGWRSAQYDCELLPFFAGFSRSGRRSSMIAKRLITSFIAVTFFGTVAFAEAQQPQPYSEASERAMRHARPNGNRSPVIFPTRHSDTGFTDSGCRCTASAAPARRCTGLLSLRP